MVWVSSNIIDEWEWVLKRAWSVRFLIIAAILSGLEIALPLLDPLVSIQYRVIFSIVVFFTIVAAFIARFVAQKTGEA